MRLQCEYFPVCFLLSDNKCLWVVDKTREVSALGYFWSADPLINRLNDVKLIKRCNPVTDCYLYLCCPSETWNNCLRPSEELWVTAGTRLVIFIYYFITFVVDYDPCFVFITCLTSRCRFCFMWAHQNKIPDSCFNASKVMNWIFLGQIRHFHSFFFLSSKLLTSKVCPCADDRWCNWKLTIFFAAPSTKLAN